MPAPICRETPIWRSPPTSTGRAVPREPPGTSARTKCSRVTESALDLRYHLTLSFAEGAPAPPRAEIDARLKKHGFAAAESGPDELPLGHGALRAERTERSLQLSFPLGLPEREGERAVDAAFLLAGELKADLFDLQLSATILPGERRRVIECWKQNYRIQLGLVGPESLGQGMPSRPAESPSVRWMKVTGAVIGMILLAFALYYASCKACVLDPISRMWH